MEIKVKIRFNASKEMFESYGGGKYLIYLPFEEDSESKNIIIELLSRKIGTSAKRISFENKDVMGNWVFQLS